jgi:MFS family permease
VTSGATAESSLPRPEMLLVGGVVLAISIGAFFRVPLLPSIGSDLSMSAGQLGLITTVFAIGRLVTDIPAGRLADRTAPLRALSLAGLTLGVGSVALASAPTASWVIGAAFVLGVASALSNTTGMTFFSTAAPARQRGSSMAAFSAALLGGQALGPMIGGLIAGQAGWRFAIGCAAAIGVSVALYGTFSRRVDRMTTAAAAGRRSVQEDPVPPPTAPAVAAIPLSQRVVLYAVAFSSFFMLGSMPQTLVPIIGDARFGLGVSTIGLALGLGGGCRFVGAMVGGRLADRISRRASLIPGMALSAVGVAVFALDLGVAGWVAGIVLFSLGSFGVSVAATMLADHAGGNGVGRRLGTYRFIGDLGLITGPALSGLLYERVSADAAVLSIAGLLAVVTILCVTTLHETRWLEEEHT